MIVVGTPPTEPIIAAMSSIFGNGIIWDNKIDDPYKMVEKCKPDLILVSGGDQDGKLSNVAKEINTVVINAESRFTSIRNIWLKPAANILQLNGGKRSDEFRHKICMFLYKFHRININKINQIIDECSKYSSFGLFGDVAGSQFYKGIPTLAETANIIASSDITICVSEEDCYNVAINSGYGLSLSKNNIYPEFSETNLAKIIASKPSELFVKTTKQKIYESDTILDRALEILDYLRINAYDKNKIKEIKEKAFNK